MIFIYLYQQAKFNFFLHNYHFYLIGVRPQLTFLFTVSHECRAREIVKRELNKFICDMSAFEHKYSQVCLKKLLAVK